MNWFFKIWNVSEPNVMVMMGPESSKSWYLSNVDRRNPAPRSLAMSAASADSGSGETTSSWIYARGLITYILAIGTVAVALVLVVSALLGTDGRAAPCDHQSQVGLLPVRANKASTSEALHARRVCSFTMSRLQLGVRRPHSSSADRTSSPKARVLPPITDFNLIPWN